MKGAKPLLDDPTDGWRADLPLPQVAPSGPLFPIGRPPNFANDKYLELSATRRGNRTVLLFFSLVVLVTALLSLIYFFLRQTHRRRCWSLSPANFHDRCIHWRGNRGNRHVKSEYMPA